MRKTAVKPKQRDSERTKLRILSSAQHLFATQGYAQTGIRDIARDAGVSTTIMLRYFGSKIGVFETALSDAMPVDIITALDTNDLGVALVGFFIDEKIELLGASMIALSIGDPEAQKIASRITEERVIKPMAKWLGAPSGKVRALEIFSLSMGFVLCTRQLRMVSMNSATTKKFAEQFAEKIQEVVDR